MDKRWPNFFIVGATKAGTTSLYSYLRQHPEIFMPGEVKEPHYFAQVHPSNAQRYASPVYINDQEAYLKLFSGSPAVPVIGEASPSYLWCERAPGRIAAVSPEAKILVALRDPVERAYSHYLMDYREGMQHRPFFDALQADWRSERKGWAVSFLYVELGFYARQIARYFKQFGRQRVLVVLYDDLLKLRNGQSAVLTDILTFLGVDPAGLAGVDISRVENGFAAPRAEWARRLAGAQWARWIGHTILPRSGASIFNRWFVKPGVPPPIDPRARDWLAEIYEPEIVALEDLLGCAMPSLRRSWNESAARRVLAADAA